MRHLLYLINPISGTSTKSKLQHLIEDSTEKAGIKFSILPSSPTGDYRSIADFIQKNKVTDIVIAGGDGTVNQAVGGLKHLGLNFGIIPCGSGNGLAFAAGIPRSPSAALDLIFSGKSKATDGFLFNKHFACMLCGLGFDAKVAHDFAQQSKRGLANYVKMVVRNFFSASTWSFELRVKEKTFHTEAFFISIANSNQFGNNFTIAPKASLSDGLLDVVIVTKQNKLNVLLNTLSQIMGRHSLQADSLIDQDKAVIYFQTDALSIRNLSSAPLHIDGDPAESPETADIRVLPSCFKLICVK
jgi:YegS/Rv2252/BmrU family lipid kinase